MRIYYTDKLMVIWDTRVQQSVQFIGNQGFHSISLIARCIFVCLVFPLIFNTPFTGYSET